MARSPLLPANFFFSLRIETKNLSCDQVNKQTEVKLFSFYSLEPMVNGSADCASKCVSLSVELKTQEYYKLMFCILHEPKTMRMKIVYYNLQFDDVNDFK